MMNQVCTPLGFVTVAVPGSTGIGFASVTVAATTLFVIPSSANMVLFVVETGPIRWRDDGGTLTVSTGVLVQPTVSPFEYSGSLGAIRFLGVTGTVQIDASFYHAVG
jgi:hypothetical protein